MKLVVALWAAVRIAAPSFAQSPRPSSPAGSSSVELGSLLLPNASGDTIYTPGRWIEVTYGRPLKRGRNLFGDPGPNYGKVVNPDARVWRAGSNQSTQLKTEIPIVIGGKVIPEGTYTLFIDLQPDNWTLIVSRWKAQTTYNPNNKFELWGSYNYTPDKDVVRTKMTLTTLPNSHEQLSWEFLDVSPGSATLAIIWDKTMASVPIEIAQ